MKSEYENYMKGKERKQNKIRSICSFLTERWHIPQLAHIYEEFKMNNVGKEIEKKEKKKKWE